LAGGHDQNGGEENAHARDYAAALLTFLQRTLCEHIAAFNDSEGSYAHPRSCRGPCDRCPHHRVLNNGVVCQAAAVIRHRLDSISDFARQGYNLRFTCGACGHVVDANAIEMMRELHRRKLSLKVSAVERRAKCSACGERKAKMGPVIAQW
jgi:hypothetical protein